MSRLALLCLTGLFAGCFNLGDLQSPSGADAGASRPPDLYSEPSLCASGGGVWLAPGKWACPGPFLAGGFAGLCGPRAKPCESAEGIDPNKCRNLPGFFAANVGGYSPFPMCSAIDPMNFACTDKPSEQRYFFRFGCGFSEAGNFRSPCERTCSGFDAVMICQQVSGGYSCKGFNSTEDRNEAENNGVLCCAA